MTTDDVKALAKEQYWRGRREAMEQVRQWLLDDELSDDAVLERINRAVELAARWPRRPRDLAKS